MTGSSRGIGAAIAESLGKDGWPVGVNYVSDSDAAASTTAAIESHGARALAIQADVTQDDAVGEMFSKLEAEFGPVLVLVNNVGIRIDKLAAEISDQEWDKVIDSNLSAAFRVTRRALMPMIRARFGRIVNVSSVVGIRANAGQVNYAAAKAGLIGMTKSLAAEVGPRGITVNAVVPGFIETDLTADVSPETVLPHIPLRRQGQPSEVAACARFLASEEAGYVTGATLVVDGGLSA